MPLARYFLFVGGVLLTLLFAVNLVTPAPELPIPERTNTATDVPALRIHSDRKWPERVVIDTSQPTIVPQQPVTAEAKAPDAPAETTSAAIQTAQPAAAADISAKARVRESLAQVRPSEEKKPEAKLAPKRKLARTHAAPPPMRLVEQQQPRFGWFGTDTW